MPAVATLTNSASTLAFSAPAQTKGFMVWSTAAAALRLRMGGKKAAASGAFEGIPIPAGSSTEPKYFIHYFNAPLKRAMDINIFQNSGGNITSGVGYELLND
jgi:hypothetical protein